MRKMRLFHLMFWVIYLGLSSCGLHPTIVAVNTSTKIPTFTPSPVPTWTATPAPSAVITPAILPYSRAEPGLIVTLGEKVDSPWYPGIPVFSPDGKIIALANSRIRLWDVYTHELVHELENPYPEGCYVSNAVFSPDGSLFAVSITGCWTDATSTGHLFVWDVASGSLLRDWVQEYAHMPAASSSSVSFDYSIPVSAMAFLPNSSKIIFANGNTLEIHDVLHDGEPAVIDLGTNMFASQISLPSDGRFVYVLMVWDKTHDFPIAWTQKKKLQIWDPNTKSMRREIKYG